MNARAKIPFDAAARVKLAKLLGMTGSANDNEALVAMRKANALVRDSGLQWLDVVALGVHAATTARKPRKARTPKQPRTWRDLCRAVAVDKGAERWQRDFCRDLLGSCDGPFTRRQLSTLQQILETRRARARERSAA